MRVNIVTLACALLLTSEYCYCKDSKLDRMIVFEPMTEYMFQLKTNADMKSTQIESTAKIGLTLVRDLPNSQEIYLDVHYLDSASVGRKVMLHEEHNIARWFSFKIRPNGVVFEVVYPVNADPDVITLKKSITAMFSGHLNVSKFAGDETWQYYAYETGTEGVHHSSYTASKSNESIIFKKVRLTHPIVSGHAVHEKEIHFNSDHKVPTQITLNEHFQAPKEEPSDNEYDYEGSNENKIKGKDDDEQVFPEMSVTSASKVIFLYSQVKNTPKCLEKNLTTDTLHIKSVRPNMVGFNETLMWSFINGNLSCIKEKEVKESLAALYCFQDLVEVFREVPDSHIQHIIDIYMSTNGTKRLRQSIDRLIIMDALVATRSVFIQDLITDIVFLSTEPNKLLVERFLMLSISNNETVSKHFVGTLQKFVNYPNLFPASLSDVKLHQTALMALGAIASHLKNLGRYKEAIDLVTGIEDRLGIHDPWNYNTVLSTMSPEDQERHHWNTAAMVEALGNAALDQSFEHIMSFTNSTNTPHILRRSGLHSLRKYSNQQVANVLLNASQNDVSKQVRHFAATLHHEHPYGKSLNDSQIESNISEPLTRSRRDFPSSLIPDGGWEFNLPFEPIHVLKKTGNKYIGGYWGYDLKNSLKLRVGLLNGILELEANNRAFAGFFVFRKDVDLLTADQCFDGAIEIRINPFKEIKCAVVEQFLAAFDRVIKHYINILKGRIEEFSDWLLEWVSDILDDFHDALEFIIQVVNNAIGVVKRAQEFLSSLNPDFLIVDALDSVLRVMQKVHDLLLDLKMLYYKASQAVNVILETAFEQLINAIEYLGNNISLANILTAPHAAVENLYKGIVNSETATNAILDVRQTLEEVVGLADELNSKWTWELQRELERSKADLDRWIDNAVGKTSKLSARQSQNEHLQTDFLDDLIGSISHIRYVTNPLKAAAQRFSEASKTSKRLFLNLRNSYLDTKHQVVELLGPSVHRDFPRQIRLAGSGCYSNGLYPTTADGYYSDQGIDLITEPAQKIVAPFSGAVSRSSDTGIRLVPKDGSFINTVIYIDNVIPAESIPMDDYLFVAAGEILGATANDGPCGSRHIHFVVKSEIDHNSFDSRDKRSPSDGGLMDPSPYMNDRLLEIGAFKRGCDDITVKIVGMAIVRGRLTQPLKKVETPYKHDFSEPSMRKRRDLQQLRRPRQTSSWFSEIPTDILDTLGISPPEFGKSYSTTFDANNVKIGNLLSMFQNMGSNDNVEEITSSLHNLAMQIADRPCVNPQSLTDRQLVQELYKRGRSIAGSRSERIRHFRSPDDRCPLLQVSIPNNCYCHIDPTCLALECCLNVPLLTNQILLKAFVRYEPCLSKVFIGILDWRLNIEMVDTDIGLEDDIYYDVNVKGVGQQKILLRYKLEKSSDLLLVSLSFALCSGEDRCLVFYDVFRESAFLTPNCYNNDIQSWDEVDISDYFQRASLINSLKQSGQVLREVTPQRVAETLNISTSIISDLPKCHRPDDLRMDQLQEVLKSYGESIYGTRQQLLDQLMSVQQECDNISISKLASSVADMMYCYIFPTCHRLECCLSIDVDGFKPSFRLFMELRSCDTSFVVGLEEDVIEEKLDDIPKNGYSNETQYGWIKLQYSIKRSSEINRYYFSLTVSVCPGNSNCVMAASVIEDQTFSVTPCNTSEIRIPDSPTGDTHVLPGFQPMQYSSMFDEAVTFWKKRIANDNTTFTATQNMNTKISSVNLDGRTDKEDEQLWVEASIGMIPLQFLLQKYTNDKSRVDFDNPLRLPLHDEGSITWPGIDVIGSSLTENGAAVITQYLMERTLLEIGLLLEMQDISQLTTVINKATSPVDGKPETAIWEKLFYDLLDKLKTWALEFVSDNLYVTLPPEFVVRDFVTTLGVRIPQHGRLNFFPLKTTFPIPIGIAVLEFRVAMGAGVSIGGSLKLTVGTMTYKIDITPGVAVVGQARLALKFFFFRIAIVSEIEILGTDFPLSREANYCKFPVEITDRVDVVITPLAVRLYIKAWIKVWIFKITLFRKQLWSWSAPPIRKTLYLKEYTKNDDTIPRFFDSIIDEHILKEDDKRSLQEVLQPGVTRSCFVKQVIGLDYTEPAVYLQVAANDDVSFVTYTVSVGTEPGGNELIKDHLFVGPTIIISEGLVNGVPLYFTVRAKNSQGGFATAFCSLPTFDTTLPGGRVEVAFKTSSHPGILKASAVLYDDSDIAIWKASVGFGVGLNGDQIVPWHIIDSSERQSPDALGNNEFDQFTSPKIGRLISKPIATMIYLNPNLCARDCLDLPRSKCISFNYDYGDSKTCELLEQIEGHGVTVHRSGLYSHYERLGVGHAVAIYHENLQLQHNNLYYFNIHVTNVIGYENIQSSAGVLVDFVPPEPGKIVNAMRDETIWEQCSKYTPEEWQNRCVISTSLPNHRIIIDGAGSKTVFNGHEPFKDLLFTKANEFISANWDGFHDNETGIFGYTWSVGSSICGDDVSSHIDPHSHLFDESEWNHQGSVNGIYLEDGHYFISVRAFNKIEFGGPMALTVCHATPYIIDTSPPIIHDISNVTYALGIIGVTTNCSDPESGVMRSDFALGVSPRDTYILGWQLHPYTEFMEINFKIPDNIPAWVRIRCVNNVELASTGHSDTAFLVDSTPPVKGVLNDGSKAGADEEFFKDENTICSNWQDFHDNDSGISSYVWAIGSYPGGVDVVDVVHLDYDVQIYCEGSLNLEHGQKYFATLVAFNGGFEMLNVSESSNGVLLDLTPPESGYIKDGKKDDGIDIEYSSQPASVSAFWDDFYDPESSIADYIVSVHRQTSSNGTVRSETIHQPESVGKEEYSIEWHHFNLQHNDFVHVNLQTLNGAGNHKDVASNGYRVDLTPPVLQALGDGPDMNVDIEYQTYTDRLSVHWQYEDLESGIIYYQLAIYELKYGNKRKIYPADLDDNSFMQIDNSSATGHTQDNLLLRPGHIYTSLIKAVNGAQLVASHETTGIIIDSTPPRMEYVRAGAVDGEREEVLRGYVYQSDRFGIQASWRGRDPESTIASYWVAVGSNLYSSDIREFQYEGPDSAGYISGLNLSLTNDFECDNNCQPVYFVCVKAQNGAGQYSDVDCSSPIKVVAEDKTGYVRDGPNQSITVNSNVSSDGDVDAQVEVNVVTITFSGFASTLNGLRSFQWAIGTTPGGEDIQPYMTDGIMLTEKTDSDMNGLSGNGKAQAHVDLSHGTIYYASIRAITGSGKVLESSTDGFTVDQTPPDIKIQELGKRRFSPETQLNELTGSLYDDDSFSITASWIVNETESATQDVIYYVASYPYGTEASNVTSTKVNNIPIGSVKPALLGKPNLVHVEAVNTVGLRRKIVAPSLVTDLTGPIAGKVMCPAYLHAGGILRCQWSGFTDPEGIITSFNFLLGIGENRDDILRSDNISAHLDSYVRKVNTLNLTHNTNYYVTMEAVNSVGKRARAFSKPFLIDDTPPVPGVVVEFADQALLNGLLSREEYLQLDLTCINSLSHLSAAWEPFVDPETTIVKYEVAVGTSPFGAQVKGYFDVGKQTTTLITNIDLSFNSQIYVSVRGYNEAGLSSTVSSNGVFISRLNIGLPPLHPLLVNDGPEESDRDFQESLIQIDATWDFSGYPCPMKRFEWSIRRIDGTEMQPFTEIGDQTYGTNSELLMANGQTYYVVVRGTNIVGSTVTARSDGIVVQQFPLVPGHVFDGPFLGRDINYQLSTNVLHASWSSFVGGRNSLNIDHTGNDEIPRSVPSGQIVEYYEVAVGSDRSFLTTRDDIVPFKNVGTNTSVVFDNLDLTALTTVFVTVRAHSVSFTSSEVSSNGITVGHHSSVMAGEITVPTFSRFLDTLDVQWSHFESPLDIIFYYVAITDDLESASFDCKNLQTMLQNTSTFFNVLPLQLTYLDTYKQITGLKLKHLENYSVIVIGYDEAGECNSTLAMFTVDITPPLVGVIKAGSYLNLSLPLDYTASKEELHVWWNGFKDEESGTQSYRIRLLSASSCEESAQTDLDTISDWVTLNGNLIDFQFVNISLSENQPYFAELGITNNAGNRNSKRSPPILFDNNVPSAGKVVDGVDFKLDKQFQGETSQISGSFLHLADKKANACPLQKRNFEDMDWAAIYMVGLRNMDTIPWDIWYSPEQIEFSDDGLEINIERDLRKPRILTGGFATKAHISPGGKYEVDILAASDDMNAVTTIVFWDGPENTIGGYQEKEQLEEEYGESCACCFWDFENITCLCNCSDVIKNNLVDNSSSLANPKTSRAPETFDTTSLPVEVGSSDATEQVHRACGLQLKSEQSQWKAEVWCRFEDDKYDAVSIDIDLPFDPSEEWHTYSLLFTVTPVNAEDHWMIDLYIDGEWHGEIDGIPELSDTTKIVLHAWNEDNFLPDLDNVFAPPTSVAHFRNLRTPPSFNLCRYGDPFRGSSSPVFNYMVGVGSQPQIDDVVSFQEVAKPCIPCLRPCDRFLCDIDCRADTLQEFTFTLNNLTLPENSPNDNITTLLYLTVKSTLVNGESVVASSNGIIVDTSPPVLDLMFYIDDDKSEYQPVLFQSSNTTIKAYWSFIDDDSLIKETQWSIGSHPGGTDLQDFVSVGLEQLGTNSNLSGRLFHNHTYFVTLRSINGAGLSKTIECPGVTVLIDSPIPDGVNATSLFTERLPGDVYPQNITKMNNGTHVGMSWTEADDPYVTRYEYCVGSAEDAPDDIVACIPVASNSSGSVAVSDGGSVVISSDTDDAKLNITDFPPIHEFNDTAHQNTEDRTSFNMEPGKTVYNTIQVCNSAGICSPVQADATTVINDEDQVVTSVNGSDINLPNEVNSTAEARRKRSIYDYNLNIQTTGGLHKGGSLVFGYLNEGRTNQIYDSDAVTSYRPYIVNPSTSMHKISRELQKRIRLVHDSTFFLTSLGQVELNGPLIVNISFRDFGNVSETLPLLVYWNPDVQQWRNAAKTCTEEDNSFFDKEKSLLSVQVCSTRKERPNSRTRRVSDDDIAETPRYFSRETHFAVIDVVRSPINEPPVILNAIDTIRITEDEGAVYYQFLATDSDGDQVKFALDPDQPKPLKGVATMTHDGLFTYTPLLDRIGEDILTIIVEEVQLVDEIKPLSQKLTFNILITEKPDEPVLFIAQNGNVVGSQRNAYLTVEENTGHNIAYHPVSFVIGAYDVDFEDTISLEMKSSPKGKLTLVESIHNVNENKQCNSESNDLTALPCGLEIPHKEENMVWLISNFTYSPRVGVFGSDQVKFYAKDKTGLLSRLLTVFIRILRNPCLNGFCKGPDDDINCTLIGRSTGFDGYTCECLPGYIGSYCQTCESSECATTMTMTASTENEDTVRIFETRSIAVYIACATIAVVLIVIVVIVVYLKRKQKRFDDTRFGESARNELPLKNIEIDGNWIISSNDKGGMQHVSQLKQDVGNRTTDMQHVSLLEEHEETTAVAAAEIVKGNDDNKSDEYFPFAEETDCETKEAVLVGSEKLLEKKRIAITHSFDLMRQLAQKECKQNSSAETEDDEEHNSEEKCTFVVTQI